MDMKSPDQSPIDKLRRLLGTGGDTGPSMAQLSTDGGILIEQTQMAPQTAWNGRKMSPTPNGSRRVCRTSGPFVPCSRRGFPGTLASSIQHTLVKKDNRYDGVQWLPGPERLSIR